MINSSQGHNSSRRDLLHILGRATVVQEQPALGVQMCQCCPNPEQRSLLSSLSYHSAEIPKLLLLPQLSRVFRLYHWQVEVLRLSHSFPRMFTLHNSNYNECILHVRGIGKMYLCKISHISNTVFFINVFKGLSKVCSKRATNNCFFE